MRLSRLHIAFHTQIAAGKAGGKREIGIHIGAGKPVFYPGAWCIGMGHPERGSAIVHTPVQVDRRGDFRGQAPIGIHIGRIQAYQLGGIALQTRYVTPELVCIAPLFIAEYVLSGRNIDKALVNVHRTAGLCFHGFGHKCGVDPVLVGCFAHCSLEREHLVCQLKCIAMQKIDFHLGSAVFVNQRVDFQLLRGGIVVHVFNKILEFRNGIDAVGQARGFIAP